MGTSFGNLCLALVGAIGVHIVFLITNHVLARYVLRLKRPDYKACLICGSQKTLPVAITVISYFPLTFDHGLMAVPCILGHLSQLFIDSALVLRLVSADEKREARLAAMADSSTKGLVCPSRDHCCMAARLHCSHSGVLAGATFAACLGSAFKSYAHDA